MSSRTMFIVTSVIAGIGCIQTDPIQKTSIQALTAETELLVSSDNTTDIAILELVLSDLCVYNGVDCPLSLPRDIPRDIYVSPMMIDVAPQPAEPLEQNHLWSQMTDMQRRLTKEAIKHIGERYAAGDSLRNFRSTSDTIRVVDTEPSIDTTATDLPYGARFPVRAWAPGYSRDGSCVVLHLYFPELLHPSYATYVLMSTDGEWRVTFRAFVTYV